ncbi:hypothetical protein M752DRAFT_283758 [Aspergillus phoenicis ATCC 13157]|uniref:MFS general substrate transporter n=1 Tax=Aspergillus phoenicis ATCC 13157 TaxID=1353007 RepID=A0A370PJJ6_ASPPH|nr:hypothetical protein M752DRAFT_283758 [Aspergillus phoenicis ATCC 13157]
MTLYLWDRGYAGDEQLYNLDTSSSLQVPEIGPENEVKGPKLLLLHTGLCLCIFLVGLLAQPAIADKTLSLFSKMVIYLSYVALFEVGRLICALAPSSPVFIVGRAIAGLGASGILAGGLVILTNVIVRPILGEALTQHVKWLWCSYINISIAEFSAVVVLESIPLTRKLQSLDGVGFFLFLVLWQLHMQEAVPIPPRLFPSSRKTVLICTSTFFANVAFQCTLYWLPIWFQAVLGASPTSSGVRYLPIVISDVLIPIIVAGLISGVIGYSLIVTMVSLHCILSLIIDAPLFFTGPSRISLEAIYYHITSQPMLQR